MLVTSKKILKKAHKEYYAVPAMNISNIEMVLALVEAAEEMNSPLILQTTESAINYAGLENLAFIMKKAAKNAKVPIAVHLDHGPSIELAKKCINEGYTSVMIDGSKLPFKKNVAVTKKVVKIAKKRRVSVEAELGTIGGKEDNVKSRHIILTNPDEAKEFVEKTNIDILAVAVGTSHGAYKFHAKAKIDITRIKEIKELVNIPLVLHGASGLPHNIVKKAAHYGAKLGHPEGVPNIEIRHAIRAGVNKINIDSDTRLTLTASIREFLKKNPKVFDPRKILSHTMKDMKANAIKKMKLFDSVNKA